MKNRILRIPIKEEAHKMEDILIDTSIRKANWMNVSHLREKYPKVYSLTECGNEYLLERGILRELLTAHYFEKLSEDDIVKAEQYLINNFTHLWNEDKSICISIWALQFIELYKSLGNERALIFAREHFPENKDKCIATFDPDGYIKLYTPYQIFNILFREAHKELDLRELEARTLISPIQREAVSDLVNKKLLELKNIMRTTAIERILKQILLLKSNILKHHCGLPRFKLKV